MAGTAGIYPIGDQLFEIAVFFPAGIKRFIREIILDKEPDVGQDVFLAVPGDGSGNRIDQVRGTNTGRLGKITIGGIVADISEGFFGTEINKYQQYTIK